MQLLQIWNCSYHILVPCRHCNDCKVSHCPIPPWKLCLFNSVITNVAHKEHDFHIWLTTTYYQLPSMVALVYHIITSVHVLNIITFEIIMLLLIPTYCHLWISLYKEKKKTCLDNLPIFRSSSSWKVHTFYGCGSIIIFKKELGVGKWGNKIKKKT